MKSNLSNRLRKTAIEEYLVKGFKDFSFNRHDGDGLKIVNVDIHLLIKEKTTAILTYQDHLVNPTTFLVEDKYFTKQVTIDENLNVISDKSYADVAHLDFLLNEYLKTL